jgi:hypothetical protein
MTEIKFDKIQGKFDLIFPYLVYKQVFFNGAAAFVIAKRYYFDFRYCNFFTEEIFFREAATLINFFLTLKTFRNCRNLAPNACNTVLCRM